MKPYLLLVDDEEGIRFGFKKYLTKAGYSLKGVASLSAAKKAVLSRRFDAVLLDLNLPDGNGLGWISELRDAYPDIAIVVITGVGDIPLAVECMRRGADDFLTKPINMADLHVFLRKNLELGTLRRRQIAEQRLSKKNEPYLGQSPVSKELEDLAGVAARNNTSVVIQGETGTGKGVLARWIHENSSRSHASFVEVSCSSLRGELLSNELFGHARGAFTSAVEDRKGLIEIADGGTLFLDEIGDMDIDVQSHFLKVIEERQYRRLGEVKTRRSEFRVICATNRNLLKETSRGNFRRDLYFRIMVFPINMPPLRERIEDLEGIIEHIFKELGSAGTKISPEALNILRTYSWPGNIRELRNVLERSLLLSKNQTVTPAHFPGLNLRPLEARDVDQLHDLAEMEKQNISKMLEKFDGDATKASKALNISRATLYRKMKR